MIKVTLGEVKPQEEKPFPKLMIHKDGSFIVLFTHTDKCVCLWSNDKDWKVGDLEDFMEISEFIDYNKPITIQNA